MIIREKNIPDIKAKNSWNFIALNEKREMINKRNENKKNGST
jgi:hypothetical protein